MRESGALTAGVGVGSVASGVASRKCLAVGVWM
jgi:hypothetical protein